MKRVLGLFLAPLALGALVASGLIAQASSAQTSRGEQDEARKDLAARKVLPLREIEKMIVPQMSGMQYLGPAYDSVAMAYRLKFIKNGKVMFVDVDARSGRILSRSE